MIIQGKVTETRTFLSFVTLFVLVSSPEKLQGKIVKFTLNNDNCSHLLKWAQLQSGDLVTIQRIQNSGIPRNRKYVLDIKKSQSLDIDDIEE